MVKMISVLSSLIVLCSVVYFTYEDSCNPHENRDLAERRVTEYFQKIRKPRGEEILITSALVKHRDAIDREKFAIKGSDGRAQECVVKSPSYHYTRPLSDGGLLFVFGTVRIGDCPRCFSILEGSVTVNRCGYIGDQVISQSVEFLREPAAGKLGGGKQISGALICGPNYWPERFINMLKN
jgi:hypothetical protein